MTEAAWLIGLLAGGASGGEDAPWSDGTYFDDGTGWQTEAVGGTAELATETTAAFPLTWRKTRAVGLTTETSLAQALGTRLKAKAVQLAVEGASVAPLVGMDTVVTQLSGFLGVIGALRPIGALLPTGGFQHLTLQVAVVELITEQTLAQPLGQRLKAKAVGLAAESSTAFALEQEIKVKAAGLSAETSLAQPVTGSSLLVAGLAPESAGAFTVAALKAKAVGLAEEADVGFGLLGVRSGIVGLGEELAAAQAVTGAKVMAAGLVDAAAEQALALNRVKLKPVGPAIEGVTTNLVSGLSSLAVGLAESAETALAANEAKAIVVGLAESLESPFAVVQAIGVSVGMGEELALAFPLLQTAKVRTAELAQEIDDALPVTAIGQIIGVVAFAAEAADALNLTSSKVKAILQAESGIEIALPLGTTGKSGLAALAESVESALAPIGAKALALGQAETLSEALQLSGAKLGVVVRTESVESALAVGLNLTFEVGQTAVVEVAHAVGRAKERQLFLPEESALAQALVGLKVSAILQAAAVEEALAVSLQVAGQAGLAGELATALVLGRAKALGASEGAELAEAFALTSRIGTQVGMAGDTTLALQIDGRGKSRAIALATEQTSALFALQFAGAMRYIALRGRMVDRVTLHGRHGL